MEKKFSFSSGLYHYNAFSPLVLVSEVVDKVAAVILVSFFNKPTHSTWRALNKRLLDSI